MPGYCGSTDFPQRDLSAAQQGYDATQGGSRKLITGRMLPNAVRQGIPWDLWDLAPKRWKPWTAAIFLEHIIENHTLETVSNS